MAARARERWLRAAAADDATFAGMLLDLAERRAPVVVQCGPRRHAGPLRAVGRDFCAVRVGDDDVLVAFGAITAVRTRGGAAPTGARAPAVDVDLAGALAALVQDRPRLVLVAAGEPVTGELRAAGGDVVGLATGGPGSGEVVLVPLATVTEAWPAP